MNKMVKYAGLAVAGVVFFAGTFAAYVAASDIPRYEPGKIELKVEITPARVERGRKLATVLCTFCHLNPRTGQLTGKQMEEAPPQFGPIFSANITQDPNHGIAKYTDGELAYLLRTGVTRDGRYVPPYMVKLPLLADEDLLSIIAFLRSDDPLVKPVAADPPGKTQPSFLTKLLTHTVWKPLPYPTNPIAPPDPKDAVATGGYLLNAALDCYACHSADFKTMNPLHPEKTPGFMGGGNELLDIVGGTVHSANITFDEETGIGRWSREQFVRALKTGIRPDGRALMYPMLPLPALSDEELGAMYSYLQTIPKIRNEVPAIVPPQQAGKDDGRRLYEQYGCSSCHGHDGVGLADLRGANKHYPKDEDLERWIRNPQAIKPGVRMPIWDGVIKAEHYAPLIKFVRALGDAG